MKRHPNYTYSRKYRLAYEGGDRFIDNYLVRFSRRETDEDFKERYNITYCPAHAKAAIQEIKNAIFQRFVDIKRLGGSPNWLEACSSDVDFNGNSMSSFIGRIVLPELLPLGRVGIFVDKQRISGPTKHHTKNIRPYLYIYETEKILNWTEVNGKLIHVTLEDVVPIIDNSVMVNYDRQYRDIYLRDGFVEINILNSEEKPVHRIELNLTRIPFVIASISEPLMKDIADYQIALLNLASSDMSYAMKSNFPFYTEQYHPISAAMQQQPQSPTGEEEIQTGISTGKKYPVGTERPAFVHPSPEPLKASMDKQDQLVREIRQIVNLAVSNLSPSRSGSEAKKEDTKSLEAGLSYIGLELQFVESEIAKIWNEYEGVKIEPIIKYPTNYSIRSDEDRRKEAKELSEIRESLPSLTFQKEVSKQVASTLLSTKTSFELIQKIYDEIDGADVIVTDHDTIRKDIEVGILSRETGSEIAGYPKGEALKAEEDHARRAARLITAQKAAGNIDNPAARGVEDLSVDPDREAKAEKEYSQDRDLNHDGIKKVRGEA